MSFSSGSFCSPYCDHSGMGDHKATPTKSKGVVIANTPKDVRQDSEVVKNGWFNELRGRILLHDGEVGSYFDKYVPCSTPYSEAGITVPTLPFWEYQPVAGREVQSYPGLRNGLTTLVADFPATVRPSFVVTPRADYPFPFAAFAKNHHNSSPDISVSFPGVGLQYDDLKKLKWRGISMVVEAKATEDQDPFPKAGVVHSDTIIQIARNARALLFVHGFLAAFVVGVYGARVRIARFDRTCAVVSRPFNLRKDTHLLQRFFWHFTHPTVDGPVVGCDPTVRHLTTKEEKWLATQLSYHKTPFDRAPEKTMIHTRRVEVYDESSGEMRPYFLYKVVDINARLLSRSTMVWRAIEDKFAADPHATVPVKINILKEAWRQVIRTPEAAFYERFKRTIQDKDFVGLPRFVCGGDLGQMEVRQWELSTNNSQIMDGQRQLRLCSTPVDETESVKSSTPDPPVTEGSAEEQAPSGAATFPLPYPLHQTFTWALCKSPELTYLERSHMRFVVENVGRHLTHFRNTRELILAMRDAIKGHRLAFEVAGVLHRDVSIGNILIVDEPEENGPYGFLHDFDYSSMSDVPPGEEDSDNDDGRDEESSQEERPAAGNPVDARKEKTGTHYFIAYEIMEYAGQVIHRYYHDLESFYWVLLWVVLRHTTHNLGQDFCKNVFVYGNSYETAMRKQRWCLLPQGIRGSDLTITNNAPLTTLMKEFKNLVKRQILLAHNEDTNEESTPVLTYDAVLAIFDKAIARTDWPAEDYVRCHLLDDTHGTRTLFTDDNEAAETASATAGSSNVARAPDAGRNAISGPAGTRNTRRKNKPRVPPRIPEGMIGNACLPASTQSSGSHKKRKLVASAGDRPLVLMGPPPVPVRPCNEPTSREGGSGGGSASGSRKRSRDDGAV